MASPREEPQRIAFLLLPAFPYLGLMAAIEPLFIANWLVGTQLYRWETLGKAGVEVAASNGMPARVDGALSGAARYDAVFVLASFEPKEQARDAKLRAWLRRAARHGATLGAIETGSEVLAAAGLLDGHDVAVHWDNLQGFREVYPACRALPQLFTADAGRLTCAGATSVLDMMLHWIRERHGAALAKEVADHLLLERVRAPATPQLAAFPPAPRAGDPVLRRALDLMQRRIEEPLSCRALAKAVGLSLRQLQRLFLDNLGTTPSRHYRLLRLARAHALLQQTALPVTEVALSAGFAAPEHFSRVYRTAFGRPPSADRRQSTDAPVMRRLARREGGGE
jgi:AraC family transcriptional regulator, carnitine catabolism transcriptional activator